MPPVDGKIIGNATIWDYEPSKLFYTPSFLTSQPYPYEEITYLEAAGNISDFKESYTDTEYLEVGATVTTFSVATAILSGYNEEVYLEVGTTIAAFTPRTVILTEYPIEEYLEVEATIIGFSIHDVDFIYYDELDIMEAEATITAFVVTTP
jgi:hypothetical protein